MRKPISQRRLKNGLKAFDNYFLSNQQQYKKMTKAEKLAKEYADHAEKFPPVNLRSERIDAFITGYDAADKSKELDWYIDRNKQLESDNSSLYRQLKKFTNPGPASPPLTYGDNPVG